MSYDSTIQQKCLPDPVVDTTVTTSTGFGEESCNLRVRAYQSNYEGGKFLYCYIGTDVPYLPRTHRNHPLKHLDLDDTKEISEKWEIVADNDLVRMIIKYLSMSDQELKEKCGRVHQMEYRATLIQTLQNLWD